MLSRQQYSTEGRQGLTARESRVGNKMYSVKEGHDDNDAAAAAAADVKLP